MAARVVWRTLKLYNEDSCGTYAAAIAYYGIFSLVPLALIILSVFGLLVDRERIVDFVFEQLPLQDDPSVQENVRRIVERAQQISLASLGIGVVALVWSGSGIFAAVRRGLNAAAHRQQSRPFWRGKLLDVALIPSLGILIMLSLGLTAAVQGVIERAGEYAAIRPHQNLALRVAAYTLPALVTFTMFALLYRFVPTARPRWAEAIAGALFASLLFEIAKNVYAYVLLEAPFERETAIYAGFGTVLAFLFWIFMNASILLLGAEFSRAVGIEARAGRGELPARAGDELEAGRGA
ncbi:MAG: YihY/virulence factor BrkB family protein [Dehalococcoidia bacterium]|nr:YihY/virulence factor BrkB family protein [Dehalococcoidia bacterium]